MACADVACADVDDAVTWQVGAPRIHGVDDVAAFAEVERALGRIGMSALEVEALWNPTLAPWEPTLAPWDPPSHLQVGLRAL